MKRKNITICTAVSWLFLIITGCGWQWLNPLSYFPVQSDKNISGYNQQHWIKREEQVQIFAVRPQNEQLFFITDQNHYVFPISSKLTAILQMPQRNRLDVATHRFEQIGDMIKGNLTLSLRLRDMGSLDEMTLNKMGFTRSIEPNLGNVWKLDLYLVGKVYQGITEVPPILRLKRPYNVHIYQKEKTRYNQYETSPVQKLTEPLFLLTVPIWFTDS